MKKKYIILGVLAFLFNIFSFIGLFICIIFAIRILFLNYQHEENKKINDIVEVLSEYEYNKNNVFYRYNSIIYKNQEYTLEDEKTIFWIGDSNIIYYNEATQYMHIEGITSIESFHKSITRLGDYLERYYKEPSLYYWFSNKYYRLDINNLDEIELSEDEFYLTTYGSNYRVNINKKEIDVTSSNDFSKAINIKDIKNYEEIGKIPYITNFIFYDFLVKGNDIYIQMKYYEIDLIIKYNMEEDTMSIFDWHIDDFVGVLHEKTNLGFAIINDDFIPIINKYFDN